MLDGCEITDQDKTYAHVVFVLGGSNPNVMLNKVCSGVLIAPDWVLTSAHCIRSPNPPRMVLGWDAGRGIINESQIETIFFHRPGLSDEKNEFKLPDISSHPFYELPGGFNGKDQNDTLVLFRLRKPLVGSNSTPYPIAKISEVADIDVDANVVLTGTGSVRAPKSQARYAVLKIKNTSAITSMLDRAYACIHQDHNCKGFPSGKDSGGGWYMQNPHDNEPRLIAITQGVRSHTNGPAPGCEDTEKALWACGMLINKARAAWITKIARIPIESAQLESSHVELATKTSLETSHIQPTASAQSNDIFTLIGLSRPELRFNEITESRAREFAAFKYEIAGAHARGYHLANGDIVEIQLDAGSFEKNGLLTIKQAGSRNTTQVVVNLGGLNGNKNLWFYGKNRTDEYFLFLRTMGITTDNRPLHRILVHVYAEGYAGRKPTCLTYAQVSNLDLANDPALPPKQSIEVASATNRDKDDTALQDDEGDGYHPPVEP